MQTKHFLPQYFSNPLHPITITILGCGGTGSLLIPRIARLNFHLKEKGLPGIHLTAYDDDHFEDRNVGRQQCTPYDVGSNKAYNCIEKVNMAYRTQWEAYDYRLTSMPTSNILITAVDNINIRETIHKQIKSGITPTTNDYENPYYWIDTGNGKDFGQVILSTIQDVKQPENSNKEFLNSLPTVIDIFGDLNKSDTIEVQGIEGCSEIPVEQEQDLFINDAIAVDTAQLIQNILSKPCIDFHGVVINKKSFKSQGLLVA